MPTRRRRFRRARVRLPGLESKEPARRARLQQVRTRPPGLTCSHRGGGSGLGGRAVAAKRQTSPAAAGWALRPRPRAAWSGAAGVARERGPVGVETCPPRRGPAARAGRLETPVPGSGPRDSGSPRAVSDPAPLPGRRVRGPQ